MGAQIKRKNGRRRRRRRRRRGRNIKIKIRIRGMSRSSWIADHSRDRLRGPLRLHRQMRLSDLESSPRIAPRARIIAIGESTESRGRADPRRLLSAREHPLAAVGLFLIIKSRGSVSTPSYRIRKKSIFSTLTVALVALQDT